MDPEILPPDDSSLLGFLKNKTAARVRAAGVDLK
jgi:hypothetical protein